MLFLVCKSFDSKAITSLLKDKIGSNESSISLQQHFIWKRKNPRASIRRVAMVGN